MAVAFSAVSSSSVASNTGTSLTWSHVVGASDSAIAVTLENYEGNASVTGITVGGVSMTQALKNTTSLSTSSVQIWKLGNPPTGTQNIVVTFSATNAFCGAGGISVTGSDTSSIFSNVSATNVGGTGTAASVGVTSAVGELVVDICGTNSGPALTVGAGQTSRWTKTESGNVQASSTAPGAAGTVTMAWTLAFSGPWAMGAASFKVASGAGGVTDDIATRSGAVQAVVLMRERASGLLEPTRQLWKLKRPKLLVPGFSF